jgi:O-antigen/teichoic acid export membrane protein
MTQGLMKSAGKAAAWSAVGSWANLVGSMLSLVVLARLLDPVDFGIYGFVIVTLALPEAIACNSMGDSLIQRKDLSEGHSNSVFVLSMLFAMVFSIAIFFGAPYIGAFFGQEDFAPYLWVMSLGLFLSAAVTVPAGHLQRRLAFKKVAMVDVVGTVIGAAVGIILAIVLQSAWALILMELSRRAVRMVAFCWFDRWLPSFKFSLRDFKDLAAFNIASIGIRLTTVLEMNIPRAVVGIFLGPAALGMFNLALRVQDQAGTALISPFGAIALPFAAISQNNREMLHKMLRGAMTVATFIAYPAFLGAVAIAPAAVPIVFGDKWIPAIAAIQISLLIGLRRPTATFDAGVLKGVGRPDLVLKISLLCLLPMVFLPMAAGHSLEAVMWLVWAQKMFGWVLGALAVQKVVGFEVKQQVFAGSSALFASIIMALSVYFASTHLPAKYEGLQELLILVVLGAIVYPLVLIAVSPRTTYRRAKALFYLASGKKDLAISAVSATPASSGKTDPGSFRTEQPECRR